MKVISSHADTTGKTSPAKTAAHSRAQSQKMPTLQAVFDGVIVKPIETEDTLYGNIIVPDVGKEKSNVAEVVAVGPGKHSITGDKFIETTISVGDKVILPSMGP